MSKEYRFDSFIFYVSYDPIKDLYFCGVPGKEIPTIYVGHTEEEVKEAVVELLQKPRDHSGEDEFCDEMEISYDAQEAYCSGWIIKDSKLREREEEKRLKRHADNEKIREILSYVDKDESNAEIANLFEQWNDLEERQANLEEEKQKARMELISLAEETGHPLCKAEGIDIMKITRLGIQRSE